MPSLRVSKSKEKQQVMIDIEGEFDYTLHKEFRNAYRDESQGTNYIVNLYKTTYMDSSALGMLLLLREHAGGEHANITLNGSNEMLKKIFIIANFDQLFKIS